MADNSCNDIGERAFDNSHLEELKKLFFVGAKILIPSEKLGNPIDQNESMKKSQKFERPGIVSDINDRFITVDFGKVTECYTWGGILSSSYRPNGTYLL